MNRTGGDVFRVRDLPARTLLRRLFHRLALLLNASVEVGVAACELALVEELHRATRDEKDADAVRARLDKLAKKHIFYEALRLDWYDRLERARVKKQACNEGTISLDEFREWLENS